MRNSNRERDYIVGHMMDVVWRFGLDAKYGLCGHLIFAIDLLANSNHSAKLNKPFRIKIGLAVQISSGNILNMVQI